MASSDHPCGQERALLQELLRDMKEMKKEVKELRADNTKLQRSLSAVQEQNEQLLNTIGEVQEQNEQLQNTIGEVQEQNEQLQNTIGEVQEQNTQLRRSNTQLQNTIRELREEVDAAHEGAREDPAHQNDASNAEAQADIAELNGQAQQAGNDPAMRESILKDVLRLLKKHKGTILAAIVTGAIGAILFSFGVPFLPVVGPTVAVTKTTVGCAAVVKGGSTALLYDAYSVWNAKK